MSSLEFSVIFLLYSVLEYFLRVLSVFHQRTPHLLTVLASFFVDLTSS